MTTVQKEGGTIRNTNNLTLLGGRCNLNSRFTHLFWTLFGWQNCFTFADIQCHVTSRRYMFIGGTNFGYWNGEYSSTAMRYRYSGKSMTYFSYFLGYLRCQRTLQPAAHQLRLRRPAHRSRRPHRQILCHPKCYQNGKISLGKKRLLYDYFYMLTVELAMQFWMLNFFPKVP